MGDAEALVAVADAGPLIHLSEIGCVDLLNVFSVLHVPQAVWEEAVESGRVAEELLGRVAALTRHAPAEAEVTRLVNGCGVTNLHRGEYECLYLCRSLGVPILLTDDLAVRNVAHRLNITPVGSLGVAVKACRLNRISREKAEEALMALYEVSSLYVTRAIVETAIERL